jgi:hypothetical protein
MIIGAGFLFAIQALTHHPRHGFMRSRMPSRNHRACVPRVINPPPPFLRHFRKKKKKKKTCRSDNVATIVINDNLSNRNAAASAHPYAARHQRYRNIDDGRNHVVMRRRRK